MKYLITLKDGQVFLNDELLCNLDEVGIEIPESPSLIRADLGDPVF